MSATDDELAVGRYRIPGGDLEWSFGPTGGPGGQHANRSNTRAELRFDLGASASFPEAVKPEMLARLGDRARAGVVILTADESRSQWRNRAIARRRLAEILAEALRRPTPRRATRPTLGSRERRAVEKRTRSELKRQRRRPDLD